MPLQLSPPVGRLGPQKSKHRDAPVTALQKKWGLDVSEQNLEIGCRPTFLVPLNTKRKLGIRLACFSQPWRAS
ncbi:hypothetical protein C1H46_013952 [Malus baccata]|uniref:Uncharacterized protein n=1 Tax=Malus baccata TaxID=106549 RepID=A0A540MNT5_MALBA|nr:hypothetical protein C1H46_013952 [Malus baccata]